MQGVQSRVHIASHPPSLQIVQVEAVLESYEDVYQTYKTSLAACKKYVFWQHTCAPALGLGDLDVRLIHPHLVSMIMMLKRWLQYWYRYIDR